MPTVQTWNILLNFIEGVSLSVATGLSPVRARDPGLGSQSDRPAASSDPQQIGETADVHSQPVERRTHAR